MVQQLINAGLAFGLVVSLSLNVCALRGDTTADTRLRPNVLASFNPTVREPRIGAGTYIDPLASVIGDVRLGRRVMVAPFASIRGDEGQPIRIGSRSNIQDGVVLHALETLDHGKVNEKNLVEHNGRKYAIYIGDEVSLAHQAQVHGPAKVGDRSFIGMQALVFRAEVGEGVVVEPAAKVIGVTIAPGRYVPAGAVITTQTQADALPLITAEYAYRTINEGVIHVNTQLADGYLGNGKTAPSERVPRAGSRSAAAAETEGKDTPASRGIPATSPTPTASRSPGVATLPYLTPPPSTPAPAGGATSRGGH